MTPEALNQLLIAIQQPELPRDGDPTTCLDRVEAAAEARPHDEDVGQAFEAIYRRCTIEDGLPQVVAGVRRERLIRWGRFDSTWIGTRLEDGRPVMLRTADAKADPRRRRQLDRIARAMGWVGRGGAIVVELPGQPLVPVAAGDPALARRLATGLQSMRRRPLPCPALLGAELRLHEEAVTVVCLSSGSDPRDAVASLAKALLPGGEGPMVDLLQGLAEHPVLPEAATNLVSRALGRELAGMRHHLLARWTASTQNLRVERLASAVHRLRAALPPPRGRAAAGVDMDGAVLTVSSNETQVAFGPEFAIERIWNTASGMDASRARRLLRAQAAAPPNPRLSKQVGGDDAFNTAIGRWVSASLRLRTLSMLLEQQQTA